MNKILSLFALFSFAACASIAQSSDLNCGNGRYTNDVFPTVTKTAGITYGYNTVISYVPSAITSVTLAMDIYQPAADPAVKRPLIILAFGGAFVTGQRSDLEPLCIALAKKGYVTATIDYRLIAPGFSNILTVYGTPALLSDAVLKASNDMKAAIRFFKRDAATTKTYKIDSTKIFIGGYSAGAITALQTAYTNTVIENPDLTPIYLTNGGFEGNTDLPAPNNLLPTYNANNLAGVLNISGGVADTSLVDADNPPIYSAQGNADEVVPYNYGPISFSGIATTTNLYGSNLINTRAGNIGLNHQLLTIAGGNHASPTIEPNFSNIIAGASAFFQPIVCAPTLPITLSSFAVQNENCSAVLRWQTATELHSSHFEIETSADGSRFTKIGTVQSKNVGNGAAYTYIYQGTTGTAYFRLKLVDMDGNFTYSPVQQFKSSCNGLVQVYPNPAQLQTTVTGLGTDMQVRLMNAQGQLLWTKKATANTMQIPLAAFANGLYLVQVTDSDGKTLTNSKLIKK